MTPTEYYTLAQDRVVISRERREQIAQAQREERERRLREYQAQQQARAEVTERARQLLLSHLTKAQRETFERNNSFVVQGGRTKTSYRILGHSYSANIHVLRKNSDHIVEHRLCCHCRSDIPLGDQLLAQKLSLQYDEDSFLRIANRHPPHGGVTAYAA